MLLSIILMWLMDTVLQKYKYLTNRWKKIEKKLHTTEISVEIVEEW